jgi:hypothetical protein
MKNFILSFLIFTANICVSQTPKPDLAALPGTDEVSLTLKGLSLESKISQEQLIALKQLDLKGEQAAKYKITYYHFKTTYKRTSSVDEFYDNLITPIMTQFFTDLETNCKIIYEDIVVQNIETGKQFKLAPVSVIVKVEM